jgi:hypothetical protein
MADQPGADPAQAGAVKVVHDHPEPRDTGHLAQQDDRLALRQVVDQQ